MDNRKALMVEALAFVVLQIFFLFLLTSRMVEDGRYDSSCESYSAVQMIINFSDTIHDPAVKDMDDPDDLQVVNNCKTYNFLMVAAMVLAISCTVSAFALESDGVKGALICVSSVLLASVPMMEGAFLASLCRESERKTSSVTTFGVFQILFTAIVVILVISAMVAASSSEKKMEQEIIERLKKADTAQVDYLKEPAWKRAQQENQ